MKFKLPVFILLAVLLYAACKKDDAVPVAATTTRLNVINLSADSLNIFQNGNRLNRLSTIYPGGATGYLTVPIGEQSYQFKKNGSAVVLFSVPLLLDTPKIYTVFAAASAADKVFLVDDTYVSDTSNVALVRFVNAANTIDRFDVLLNDTPRFANTEFRSVSEFIKLTTGSKQLKIVRTGTTSTLVTDTVLLTRGNAYTIYAKGEFNNFKNPFGAGIVNND